MSNSTNSTVYFGVTNNIERRVREHKNSIYQESFTSKYKCFKLVYFELHTNIEEAIRREKNIKKWKREWKNNLINENNQDWFDLSKDWNLD